MAVLNDRCLLFLGDSFVAGAGDADGLGWPARVTAACWREGLPCTAYNLGVRGDTTPEVAARFASEARPRLIPGADNRAVIAVGANDVSIESDGERNVELEDSVAALDSILDAADELSVACFVIGPGPTGIADHDERSRELWARWEVLCSRRGVATLEVLDDLRDSEAWGEEARANDGIHPGPRGYDALAGLVIGGGLLSWVSDPAGPPAAG